MDDKVGVPSSHRLRKGRRSEPNRVYLLTTTTYGRKPLFRDFALGRKVVETLRLYHERRFAYSFAFVVMPDHVHWLAQLRPGVHLGWLMHGVKGNSAHRINALRVRCGHVWQPGYHDRGVRNEDDILPLARYVIANPVRAGLVDHVGDYPLWDATWL